MSPLALVRAVHFLSLMAIFGSESLKALFRTVLADPVEDVLPKSLPVWCASLALLTAVLWLAIVSAQLSGLGLFDLQALALVSRTTLFGHVAIVRIALLAALFLATLTSSTRARAALGAAALVAIALTSHAAAAGDPRYLILRSSNDALHLLAAGFWLGALALLAPLVFRHRKDLQIILPALRLFSTAGTIAVAVLVVAGALNGYLILFGTHGIWSPAYIGLLAFKIVLAAIMVAFAITNRFHALPAIARGQADAPNAILVGTFSELAIGVVVVLIVGALGTLAPMAD